MRLAFSIDPDQGLSEQDELQLVRLAADLGYVAAWTPSRDDTAAFDRCLRWNAASGLDVGIAAVPASGQAPEFYAAQARRTWEGTGGHFTLVVGSGRLEHPADDMRRYLADLRGRLPGQPLFVAALGPLMLRVGGELADGVALNWCTPAQVAWSRERVHGAAAAAGRPTPAIVEYIRTAVDPDPQIARDLIGAAVRPYALGPGGYRRHFERMGFAHEQRRVQERGLGHEAEWDPALLSAVGAWGEPGAVRAQVERLGRGLDLPIVRVLVRRRGDAGSARAVLEECAPGR
jgi:alkanesulfonate monooxygenase SsuD/methylene tetrahydromethanopterin reductase-like flavin-dependent oxidoreductase (luciferase family)